MIHHKESIRRVFVDLREEIGHDDPDWEQVLFQTVMACQEANIHFALICNPNLNLVYGVRFGDKIVGAFEAIDEALTATVKFALEDLRV